MNNNKKAIKRHSAIRDLLIKKDVVTLKEFCDEFNVSVATIRNDLTFLEKEGYLKRVLGGAISCEGTPKNSNYHARINLYKDEKISIAEYVVNEYVKTNTSLFLDAGTTNQYIAQELLDKDISCTVYTNSNSVLTILSKSNHIHLILCGGTLDKEHQSFHDHIALSCINEMKADLYFLSPNGIHPTSGITSSAKKEHMMKQACLKQCKEIIVVADHSKFNKEANYYLTSLDQVEVIVSDTQLSDTIMSQYSPHKIKRV